MNLAVALFNGPAITEKDFVFWKNRLPGEMNQFFRKINFPCGCRLSAGASVSLGQPRIFYVTVQLLKKEGDMYKTVDDLCGTFKIVAVGDKWNVHFFSGRNFYECFD